MMDWFAPQVHLAAQVWVVTVVSWTIIVTGLAQAATQVAQLAIAAAVFAARGDAGSPSQLWSQISRVTPPVALLVPAYNEELNIVQSVRSLLTLQYPDFEVIVINDGSSDTTLDRLLAAFEMVPADRQPNFVLNHRAVRSTYISRQTSRLVVIDKPNGGKADAQNAGLAYTAAPLVCVIDGDSILETDALIRAAQPFVDHPNLTIAVGGTIRIANGAVIHDGHLVSAALPHTLIALFQTVEYMRAFLMCRMAWSRVGSLMLVSGAFGLFRRREVLDVGGFTTGSMGEDLDLIIKLHRHMRDNRRPYRIEFLPDPVCWTEAPETLATLSRQRQRWQQGALEGFFRHRTMLFNPRYGRVGFLGMGNMLLTDVIGPITEVLGYLLIPAFWALGLLSFDHLLAFLGLVFAGGIFSSVAALALEEIALKRVPKARDLAILTLVAIIENFGYRQLNNVWRLQGWIQFLKGNRAWGVMPRTGLGNTKP